MTANGSDHPGRAEQDGLPVLLPLHPRTRLAVQRHGLSADLDRLQAIPAADTVTPSPGPAGPAHRQRLGRRAGRMHGARSSLPLMIVVRNSTERPEALRQASLTCCSQAPRSASLAAGLAADDGLAARLARLPCPFGDGLASERIAACARRFIG